MMVSENKTFVELFLTKMPGYYYLDSVFTIYKRQMLRTNKGQIIFMLIMPLMWILVIGTTFNNVFRNLSGSALLSNTNYLTFLTPGILVMVTVFTGMFSAISLFYDKESGYMKNYVIAPINRTAIITAYSLAVATKTVFQVTVLLLVALALGSDINLDISKLLSIYVFTILTTVFLMGFSITIGSNSPNAETFQSIILPISLPLQFLAPVMYPLTDMPDFLQFFAYINPLTYGTVGLRNILLNNVTDNPIDSLIIFINKYTIHVNFLINQKDFSFISTNLNVFFIIILLVGGILFVIAGSHTFLRSLDK